MQLTTWLRASGWNRSRNHTSQTGAKLDAIGDALETLTSFGTDLTLRDAQVLIAVGAVAGPHDWVELKEVKGKLINISEYQFSRHLKVLTGKKGMLSSSPSNAALIEIQTSPTSGREKQIRMTSFGNLVLHRTIQSLVNGFETLSGRTSKAACDLRINGELKSGVETKIKVTNLIISGITGTSKTRLGLDLAQQAIVQNAVVYWVNAHTDNFVESSLSQLADMSLRGLSMYVNGKPGSPNTNIEDVFIRDGICLDYIVDGKDVYSEIENKLVLIEPLINNYIEYKSNSVVVVISGIGNANNLSDRSLKIIRNLAKYGCIIHILDQGSDAIQKAELADCQFKNVIFKLAESSTSLSAKLRKDFSELNLNEFKILKEGGFDTGPTVKLLN